MKIAQAQKTTKDYLQLIQIGEDGEAESSQGGAKSPLVKMIGKFPTKPFDLETSQSSRNR